MYFWCFMRLCSVDDTYVWLTLQLNWINNSSIMTRFILVSIDSLRAAWLEMIKVTRDFDWTSWFCIKLTMKWQTVTRHWKFNDMNNSMSSIIALFQQNDFSFFRSKALCLSTSLFRFSGCQTIIRSSRSSSRNFSYCSSSRSWWSIHPRPSRSFRSSLMPDFSFSMLSDRFLVLDFDIDFRFIVRIVCVKDRVCIVHSLSRIFEQ